MAYNLGPEMLLAAGLAPGGAFDSAADARGRVTVVWETIGPSGADRDVYGRRFDGAGNPLGDAFPIAVDPSGDQASPQVLAAPDGSTVVSWWSERRLEFRRYDPEGTPIEGVKALPRTLGFSQDYELFGLTGDGFIIYADGFQLRWYGLDGSLQESISMAEMATAREGWTAVESDAPDRAARLDDGSVMLTWMYYRPLDEADGPGYVGEVWTRALGSDGVPYINGPVDELVVHGTDPGALFGMDPSIFQVSIGAFVAWNDLTSGVRLVRMSPTESELPYGRAAGKTTGDTAVASSVFDDKLVIRYLGVAGSEYDSFYFITYVRFNPRPIWGGPIWADRSDLVASTSDSHAVLATGGRDTWALRATTSGELTARRESFSDQSVGFTADSQDVAPSAGRAVAWVRRKGDLSFPISIEWTLDADEGTAVPGVDYEMTSGVVEIAAGQSEAMIVVPILPGAIQGRTFTIALRNDNPWVSPAWHEVRIAAEAPAAPDRLTFFDYDAAGAWAWGEGSGWAQVSDHDPEAVLATSGRSAVLSFGSGGLWTWDADAGWAKLNDLGPEAMARGDGGTLFLDYGAAGLWSWDGREGWAKLNDLDPARMVADDQGLFVEFVQGGLWSWEANLGYRPIGDLSPQQMTSWSGDLVLDYGPGGFWRWRSRTGTWLKLDDGDARAIAAGPTGLYVDFGPAGVRRWDFSADPAAQGVSASPAAAVADGPSGVFLGFGAAGLWLRSGDGAWAKLNDLAPATIYASATVGDAILDYGIAGLWRWSPTDGWRRINDASPRSASRT